MSLFSRDLRRVSWTQLWAQNGQILFKLNRLMKNFNLEIVTKTEQSLPRTIMDKSRTRISKYQTWIRENLGHTARLTLITFKPVPIVNLRIYFHSRGSLLENISGNTGLYNILLIRYNSFSDNENVENCLVFRICCELIYWTKVKVSVSTIV